MRLQKMNLSLNHLNLSTRFEQKKSNELHEAINKIKPSSLTICVEFWLFISNQRI